MSKHPLAVKFGLRVLELRQELGLSQEAFALRSGIARSYMSRIECGRAEPKFEVLEKLSNALGVPVSSLYEAPSSTGAKKPLVTVPFDKSGACFNPSLRQVTTGEFAVGPKSARRKFKTFTQALSYLRTMEPKAQWPRPNENGSEGVVSAVSWGPLPDEFMALLVDCTWCRSSLDVTRAFVFECC